MAKTKEPKIGSKTKSDVNPLSKVKNSTVTKSSQSPSTKSKQIAKEVAVKAMNGKKSKKAPTPSSDEESEDSEDESADSASSDSDSESEAEVKKPANGKANGNGKVKKQEVDTSDSSDSSNSSFASDSEASDSDSSGDEKLEEPTAAKDSEDSDDSDDSSGTGEDVPAPPIAKNAAKKSTDSGKAAAGGSAKPIAKATETSDEEGSDDSGSSESDEEEDGNDSSDSDEEEEEEKEVPSKKRKADTEPVASAKKSKTEDSVNEETGAKNLFVGNLSWNVDDEWLYREFQDFGEITGARVISDRESGRSKGFGYVEFAKASDAAAALKAKKGALIDGREANVDFSTPRDNAAPKDRANKRAQSFGDSKNPESDTLFVGNISFEANEDMLGEAFGAHGSILNVRLPTDMDSGNPKGYGYITFASVEDAKKAYENMMGAEVGGRPVRLDYATPRPERNGDFSRGGRGGRGGGGGGGGRGGGRGRGGFGDRGGRGGSRGGRGGSTNRGGFGDFKGQKKTF